MTSTRGSLGAAPEPARAANAAWRPRAATAPCACGSREDPAEEGRERDPAQPERMKPQFYTFLKRDAAHPSGDAVGVRGPCGSARKSSLSATKQHAQRPGGAAEEE